MAGVKSQEKEIQNLSDIRLDGRKHFNMAFGGLQLVVPNRVAT